MSVTKRLLLFALAFLGLLLAATSLISAADNDPLMGTWILNVPKSQLGAVVPKSITRKHIPIPAACASYRTAWTRRAKPALANSL